LAFSGQFSVIFAMGPSFSKMILSRVSLRSIAAYLSL
jgi:hypothetical protein